MLLILTSDQDFTADFLIVELIHRQLPYFRLNAEDLTLAEFSFSQDSTSINKTISVGPRTLDLNSVSAVWYRRSIHPTPKADLTPAERYFVAGELRHLVMGLVWNPNIIWVNPIDKVSVAEHKLYQLQLAQNLGLRVPLTLVSNNLDATKRFDKRTSGRTICKPIFHGMFFDGASRHSIYTRRLDITSLDAEDLSSCPVFLQEEIPRIADVRATLVGQRIFVADIKSNAPLIDWRDPTKDIQYSESSLDSSTVASCIRMMAELGLVYGAFDFIRTPSGELVFLEVNPTGEWAWLENTLGFPIRDALIHTFFGAPD